MSFDIQRSKVNFTVIMVFYRNTSIDIKRHNSETELTLRLATPPLVTVAKLVYLLWELWSLRPVVWETEPSLTNRVANFLNFQKPKSKGGLQ